MRDAMRALWLCVALVGCGAEEPRFAPVAQAGASGAQASEHHDGHHAAAHAEAGGNPACGEPGHHCEGAGAPVPAAASGDLQSDGSRLYGAALSERAPVSLAHLTASPSEYDGQVVQTSGTIDRVCQRMGCWMELRDGDGPAVRVPMAGHSFFLPRDSAGRPATIEGRVRVQTLTADARAHLESEGARETGSSLAIEATGVVIR